jgi:hypothetical protein
MSRLSHLSGIALLALALGQAGGHAHAATASTGFAVTVRVASLCEANGLCGGPLIRVLDASGRAPIATAGTLVTPLGPTADSAAGQRIDMRQSAGPIEIDF